MLGVCRIMCVRGQADLAMRLLSYSQRCPGHLLGQTTQLREEIARSTPTCLPSHMTAANILPKREKVCNQVGKQYDFLVMHHNQTQCRDAEWVYYSLLPRLENCHKYKGCIPVRDLQQPDEPLMMERLTRAVKDAVCIIVILTPAFCQDESCQKLMDKLINDPSCILLPLMLETCSVPESWGQLKVIQYYSWELLLQAMEKACKTATLQSVSSQ